MFEQTAIRFYQATAPKSLRDSCRFEPSRSQYTIKAIEKYGLLIGITNGTRRLLRYYRQLNLNAEKGG
jgi:putative component of membrane protein insertase Oxa1/YidC/SpoIIIJ protein YidD